MQSEAMHKQSRLNPKVKNFDPVGSVEVSKQILTRRKSSVHTVINGLEDISSSSD